MVFLTNLLPQGLIDFFGSHKRVAWTIAFLAMLGILIYVGYGHKFGYGYEWTGFGESVRPKTPTQDLRREKTLWDWLQLLIIPVFIALATLWFNRRQQRRDQQSAERRAQDDALQAYLDQMSTLLIEKDLRSSAKAREERTLARARTLTVLEQLDVKKFDGHGKSDMYRKRSVLQFLYEAGLINKSSPVINLRQANLKDANFRDIKLPCAHLSETYLPGADLSSGASLSSADLSGADLSGATVTEGQLATCKSLKDATLHNKHKYEHWLRTPKGQDWLRKYKKGPWWRRIFGADGQNSNPS